jgi:hypothetical protein
MGQSVQGTSELSRNGKAALAYASFGIPVFPLVPRDKVPLISKTDGGRGYLDATTDPATIREWWQQEPNANVGARPGPKYIVADCDSHDAIVAAREFELLDRPTLTTITARGAHFWFRLPKGVVIGNGSPWKKSHGIDVRSDAGYVVVPPSIHPSGFAYRFEGALDQIAPLPSWAVDTILKHQATPEANDRTSSADGAHSTAPGPSLEQFIASQKARGASKQAIADALDFRVRRYLEKVGPRGEGQRDDTAISVAIWLINDFGMSDHTALHYLKMWNATNTPPLPDWQIEAKIPAAHRSKKKHAAGSAHRERIAR